MSDADPSFPDGPVPGSVEYWAARTPEAIAIVDGDRRLSYATWNERSDRLASSLAGLGVGHGDRVALRFHVRTEWFVAQRAASKLGASIVAVNWRLTPDEASYIIGDSACRLLVCDDVEPAGWGLVDLDHVVVCDGDGPPEDAAPEAPTWHRFDELVDAGSRTRRFGPLRPTLVVYTSGTTGRPKGVESDSANDAELPDFETLEVVDGRCTEATTTLMTLPVHHAAGPSLAVRACVTGGTVVLLDRYDEREVLRLIEAHAVDSWTAVPTMLLRMKALPIDEIRSFDVSSLTTLSVGAAAVPFELKRWVVATFGDDVLWEGYGSTETGMIAGISPEDQLRKPGSSGLPFPGVEIRIVDDEWRDLPAGATGEIAVKTPVMRTEYIGLGPMGPELVDERGFYRTGDVGHVDEDGYLFITDRAKDMIVAGGTNIYPAEIERVLVDCPGVVDAAVIGIPHDEFGEQVMAFVVRRGADGPDAVELSQFVDERLAPYKRPRTYEFVDELPMSPVGKVLKNELRAPYWSGRTRRV